MFKNLTTLSYVIITVLIVSAFSFQGCNSQSANSGEWHIEYMPANFGRYAAVHVFSQKTGEYSQMYASEGQWKKNPNFPSLNTTITKGNLRMQYMPSSETTLPGLIIFSATTGEWIQYFLENKEWKKNPNFPQPNITLPKGDLDIQFVNGSAEVLPTLTVSSANTKEFQMFYLQDGQWKINTSFPTGTKM